LVISAFSVFGYMSVSATCSAMVLFLHRWKAPRGEARRPKTQRGELVSVELLSVSESFSCELLLGRV
jgi:hypothetical protein